MYARAQAHTHLQDIRGSSLIPARTQIADPVCEIRRYDESIVNAQETCSQYYIWCIYAERTTNMQSIYTIILLKSVCQCS